MSLLVAALFSSASWLVTTSPVNGVTFVPMPSPPVNISTRLANSRIAARDEATETASMRRCMVFCFLASISTTPVAWLALPVWPAALLMRGVFDWVPWAAWLPRMSCASAPTIWPADRTLVSAELADGTAASLNARAAVPTEGSVVVSALSNGTRVMGITVVCACAKLWVALWAATALAAAFSSSLSLEAKPRSFSADPARNFL